MPPPCWLITPPWGAPRSTPSPTACGWTGGWRRRRTFWPGVPPAYGAQLYQADLDTDGARRAVNNWVGEVTRGLIPEVLAETTAPETVLLLVNALYLKNAWASEFDPLDTRPGGFTAADGSEAETDFLSNGLRAERYFAAEGAAGVVLPYDDGRLGFLAMLPDGELDAWLETLDGDTLPALLAAAEEERVLLRLPKFEAEWGGELSDALAAMGLETAFDSGRARLFLPWAPRRTGRCTSVLSSTRPASRSTRRAPRLPRPLWWR